MGNVGFRDGKFIARKLSIEDETGNAGAVVNYSIPQCASAISTGAIMTGYELGDIGTADIGYGDTSTFSQQPPYAKNIMVTANGDEVGHMPGAGAGDSDPLYIKGYDAMGNHIQETLWVPTVADASTSTKHAFSWVSTISQRTGTVSSSSDIGVAWGQLIGLPYPIATSDDIIAYARGTFGGTTAITVGTNGYNTILANGTDDDQSFTITYRTKLDL